MTLASPRDALAVNAAALTAVMVRAVDNPIQFAELLDDKRLNACVIGPGAGVSARTRDFAHTSLSAQRHRDRLVLVNGIEVPVSRSFRVQVRQRGWLSDGG